MMLLWVHPREPTLPKCKPSYSELIFDLKISKIFTFPYVKPAQILGECLRNETEQT